MSRAANPEETYMAGIFSARVAMGASLAAAAILAIGPFAGALADGPRTAAAGDASSSQGPIAQPARPATASQTFAGPGYLPTPEALAAIGIHNPIKIEREFNRIEVHHRDGQGRMVETYLDAATGAILKQEYDRRDGRRGRGRDDD